KLLTGGMPGNKGGYGHPAKVLEDLVLVGGLTATEMLERLRDDTRRARISDENLARWLSALAPYLWPRKYEHAGPDGSAISVSVDLEAARGELIEKLKHRIEARAVVLPMREKPAPEPPT